MATIPTHARRPPAPWSWWAAWTRVNPCLIRVNLWLNFRPRPDKRLKHASCCDITQSFIRFVQSVRIQFHLRPHSWSLRHDLSGAIEVRKLGSPAASHVEMFLVEIEMRVE